MKTARQISKKTVRGLMIAAGIIILVIVLLQDKNSINAVSRSKDKSQIPTQKKTEVSVEIVAEPVIKPINPSKKIEAEKIVGGSLPPINANYRKYVGFARYSVEMRKRGARFFVIGSASKKIFEIDFDNNELMKVNISKVLKGQYCPRSKVICDEPALTAYLSKANKELGVREPEVHLLVPLNFEMKIANELSKSKVPLNRITALSGFYKQTADNFILCLNQARTTGGNFKLDIDINL